VGGEEVEGREVEEREEEGRERVTGQRQVLAAVGVAAAARGCSSKSRCAGSAASGCPCSTGYPSHVAGFR
jgi:hypothetical protein